MSADTCNVLEPGLQTLLEATYAAESLPGGVMLGVSTPTCALWSGAEGDPALGATALVKAGHVSEMIVAAAVLLASEEGLVSLEDTIDAWVPSLPNADTITVRHLLSHSSGLADYFDNQDFVDAFIAMPTKAWTPAELIAYAAALGGATPGAGWDRTRINYVVLGVILEAVTNQTAHAAIRQRVIDPLGLTMTGLAGPEASFSDVVDSYSQGDLEVTTLYHPSVDWIARAYVTNLEEMMTLTHGILHGDLLSAASRAEMFSFDLPTVWSGVSAGLGVLEDAAYAPTLVGQEGSIVGFEIRAYYAADLDSAVVIVSTNDDWATLSLLYGSFDVVAASAAP